MNIAEKNTFETPIEGELRSGIQICCWWFPKSRILGALFQPWPIPMVERLCWE